MNIAVYNEWPLPNGFESCVTTEPRALLNYALMLSEQNHNVDLICKVPFINTSYPKINILSIEQSTDKTYDVLISNMEGDITTTFIKADMYLHVFYSDMHPENHLHQRWFSETMKKTNRFKLCFGYEAIRPHSIIKSSEISEGYLETFGEYLVDLSIPIPQVNTSGNNFNKDQLVWTSKHNNCTHLPFKMIGAIYTLLEYFEKYKGKYSLYTLMTDGNIMQSGIKNTFNQINYRPSGMPYSNLINTLANSKLSLCVYYTGSFIESVLNGCLPLIWKMEKDHFYYGGINFIDKSIEIDSCLSLEESTQVTINKLDRLVSDEKYYSNVYNEYYKLAEPHTFDNVYSQFLKIIES